MTQPRCPTCSSCAGCFNEEIRNTGKGYAVAVTLTVSELEALAWSTWDEHVRERLLCAIKLVDAEREATLRQEMAAGGAR